MKFQHVNNPNKNTAEAKVKKSEKPCQPACPACGGSLIDIRSKLQCSRCYRICETCCEGGRG